MTGIPFMITQAMRAALHARGLTDNDITQLTPEAAQKKLNDDGAPLEPDRNEAEQFLVALDPATDHFTFQTFDDNRERRKQNGRHDPFARILHGTLARHWDTLVKLNEQGAGIFITGNATDLKGRSASNIKRVRAGFGDLDGAPLEPVNEAKLLPHIINETSPGRFHVYYIGADIPLDQFEPLQKAIAARFNGDPSVHDLPRVMRLPGFVHRKGTPFLVRVRQINDIEPYPWNVLQEEFLPPPPPPRDKDLREHWKWLNSEAIRRYSDWVPSIFPTATSTSNGGYRVTSADLGRDLEEDLSFHAEGIKDFGVHDMGDPRGGKRSPIDIVEEWLHKDFNDAVRWLVKKLGLNPNDYLPPNADTEEDDPKQEPQILPLRWHGEKDPFDDRAWAVDGLIPEVGTGLISGQWGTLKTFVAFELAHCIMTPRPFIGFDIVRPGGVLLIALEGQNEVAIRFQAVLEKKGGKYLDGAPFVWTEVSPPLTDPKTADIIIATAKAVASRLKERFNLPLSLILIDSLIAGAGYRKEGQDNDAALTNTIMANMAKVSRAIGCFTFVIDHFGKDTNVGTRGSSVKEGDADVIFACLGDRSEAGQVANSRLALRKRRSGPNGEEFPFRGAVVEMGVNPKTGKMETTLVIDWEETGQARTPKRDDWGRGKAVKLLRRIIMNQLVDCGEQIKPWADGPLVRALKVKLVETEFHKAYLTTGETDMDKRHAKRMAFQRAVNAAGDKVVTREVGGVDYIWLSQAGPGETVAARPQRRAPDAPDEPPERSA
jgi:AAA domain-containing protein/DNA primase RepB-like protein